MSLAYDTSISVSNGTKKAIQNIMPGDPIWVAETPDLKSWVEKPTLFSSGTGPQGKNKLIKVNFGDGKSNPNYILVHSDQPFLMPDKSLKQAKKLVPGQDLLVMENGATRPVISLEVGMFPKGVHHVATSIRPAENLNGHLLLANGVVIGDYATMLLMGSDNPQREV